MHSSSPISRHAQSGSAPDLILLGSVLTCDGKNTRAEALAITGDRIAAVGNRNDVLALASPATRVHDMKDAAILPGFIDVHAHLDTEGLQGVHHSLEGVRSIGEVQARIRAIAAHTPKGAWIVTMPIGDPPFYFGGAEVLAERRMPDRHELDAAAPDHPVCILAPSGYWSLPPCRTALNSLGLQKNGIDRHTVPRLAGLAIERDAGGEPNGVLVEVNLPEAMQLDLLPAVPRFTRADRMRAIRRAMVAYHAKGTTSIFEGHGCAAEVISIYRELHERGELTMRTGMVVSPVWRDLQEAQHVMHNWLAHAAGNGLGDSMLRVTGVFIAFGGDTKAACLQQHAHPGDIGFWNNVRQANDPAEFEQMCMTAASLNLRVHTIVVDQLQELAKVLSRINEKYPLNGRRWILEHMSTARPEDLARLREWGVGVTLIPDFHLWKVGHDRFMALDEQSAALVAPARALRELGVPVGAGTDASPCDPLAAVRSMVLRKERITGRTIGESGRLSVSQALEVMTAGGAWFTGEEHQKGRLLPGYLADCVVLGKDPLEIDPAQLESVERLATMVGGKLVYGELQG